MKFRIAALSLIWLVTAYVAMLLLLFVVNHPTTTLALRAMGLLIALGFVLILIPLAVFLQVKDQRARAQYERRKQLGLCVHCGYDLRGATGKCPECGKWTVRPANSAQG